MKIGTGDFRDIHILNRVFEYGIIFLIVFLPFSTFLSVWFEYGLHLGSISLLKEIIILVLCLILVLLHIRAYRREEFRMKISWLDILILSYILLGVGITLSTTGRAGLVYGGKYDYEFLIAFLLVYHGAHFLSRPTSYYIKYFLISGGIMLFISGLLKWPFTEDILCYFGYSCNPSNWDFGGAPPFVHGVEGANVRRFQGILDGPNSMGAFLIMYSGILAYFFRQKKEWYFAVGVILLGMVGMVFYTYSRSALIAIVIAYIAVCIYSIQRIIKSYRKEGIILIIIGLIGLSVLSLTYADRAMALIQRAGSTKGHAERMITGLQRVQDHPLGQGLGSAGPAYRYVMKLEHETRQTTEETDRFYIPESWYIQQFIEFGYLGGILFICIMGYMLYRLLRINIVLAGMFMGICIMNFFLHTFESSVLSISLFLIIGLFLGRSDQYYSE